MSTVNEKYNLVLQQLVEKIKGSRQRVASIKVACKPFEEKKSKVKEILTRVKGEEIKSAKEARHIIYI